MRSMVRDVVMHDLVSKEAAVAHEVDVLAPMAIGEFAPLPANLVTQLGQALGGWEAVAGVGVQLRACGQPIAFGGNDPRPTAFGKERFLARERYQAYVAALDS